MISFIVNTYIHTFSGYLERELPEINQKIINIEFGAKLL